MARSKYEAPPEAVEKFVEFHRFDPRKTALMPELVIPAKLRRAGDAVHVLYRSDKVDPATLKKPRKPVNYIHEHNAGVHVYLPGTGADVSIHRSLEAVRDAKSSTTKVGALVELGKCLGFAYTDARYPDDGPVEAESVAPLPELFCTPDGKVLVVIQSKRQVLAAMWGGALGVFARGIDG